MENVEEEYAFSRCHFKFRSIQCSYRLVMPSISLSIQELLMIAYSVLVDFICHIFTFLYRCFSFTHFSYKMEIVVIHLYFFLPNDSPYMM